MIHQQSSTWQTETWQKSLSNSISSPEELFKALKLSKELLPAALQANTDFPVRVPLEYLRKIEIGNPNDPLLRQVLPIGDELQPAKGFVIDPLQEQTQTSPAGLLHKYPGRVLLVLTGNCAIHCRYCFRRHFPYTDNQLNSQAIASALEYITSDNSIHEVILSGGDPLAINNKHLAKLFNTLESIPHIKRLRIHTRTPAIIPSRIDEEFLCLIKKLRFKVTVVLHINHGNEIDQHLENKLKQLQQLNVMLLNQSVLLRGVNDCADTLATLSLKLTDIGVLPYYLHLLDPVAGAHHFDVSEQQGQQLIKQLQSSLPGYMVPKLVREVPSKPSKIPISTI